MTGRQHTVELVPFDLFEYRSLRPGASLEEYLDAGGFPVTIGSPDHDRLLRGYFQDIIERDVRERVGARSSMPLRRLVQMLFESGGSETSLRCLAAALGISVDTVSLYADAAESGYVTIGCPYFAWSERKRVVRNRKYYPFDTGRRRSSVTTTGHDRGKQLECAVFLLLRRRFGCVSYWRGSSEVDFVVERDGRPTPVQVSWETVADRARRAVDEFHAAHPGAAEAVFVTAESFDTGVPELQGPAEERR